MIFFHELVVEARLVVEAFDMGIGNELDQVFIPFHIFGEKDDAGAAVVDAGLLVGPCTYCYVCVDTEDGLYFSLLAGLVELHRAVEVAVVSEGQCLHIALLCSVYEIGDFREGL